MHPSSLLWMAYLAMVLTALLVSWGGRWLWQWWRPRERVDPTTYDPTAGQRPASKRRRTRHRRCARHRRTGEIT